MKIIEILKEIRDTLSVPAIDDPKGEAEYIVSQILGKDRLSLSLDFDEEISSEDMLDILDIVDERVEDNMPLQYIFEQAYFYGRVFKVNENVLIPRPESEILVDKVISLSKRYEKPDILEIGVGSGALSITLAKENTNAKIIGVDISKDALKIAEINKKKYKTDNVTFIESNLIQNVEKKDFDIIFSNPPYISEDEYKNLKDEVKKEPTIALIAKKDGLHFYEQIIPRAYNLLPLDGYLLFEIGATQGIKVKDLLSTYFDNIEIIKDYNGFDRVIFGQKKR